MIAAIQTASATDRFSSFGNDSYLDDSSIRELRSAVLCGVATWALASRRQFEHHRVLRDPDRSADLHEVPFMRMLVTSKIYAVLVGASLLVIGADVARGADPAAVRALVEWVVEQRGAAMCQSGDKRTLAQQGTPIPDGNFSVSSVILYRSKVTDDDLKRFAVLADEKELTIVLRDTGISDAGLEHLAGLPGAIQFGLDGNDKITDAGLKHLAKLPGLRIVGLSGTGITDEGLKTVASFPALTSLALSYTKITNAGMVHLAKAPKLTSLLLTETKVTAAGAAQLKTISSLNHLVLNGCPITDADVPKLAELAQLRSINIGVTKMTDAGVEELKKGMPTATVYNTNDGVTWRPPEVLRAMALARPARMAGPRPTGMPAPALVAPPAPRADPPPPALAVNVLGSRTEQPVPIDKALQAPPSFLKGASVYYRSPYKGGFDPSGAYVEVEVNKDRTLYLAVSFAATGQATVAAEVATYRQLLRDGWIDVGAARDADQERVARVLLWKPMKAGEKFRLTTSPHFTPMVILGPRLDSNPLAETPDASMGPLQTRAVLKSKVGRLLKERKFDELETLVAGYRRDKTYTRHGQSLLQIFYEALAPTEPTEAEYEVVRKLSEEWSLVKPQSAAAHYALTDHWNKYAWLARSGDAGRTRDAVRLQVERYRTARVTLTKAADLAERDPYYFHLEAESILFHGGSAEKLEKILADSLKFDPDFLLPLISSARYYRPQRNNGDMAEYAARMADLTKERHGDGLYTLIAIAEAESLGFEALKSYGFDRARLSRGFADLRKRFPDSVDYELREFRFAEAFEDEDGMQAANKRLELRPRDMYELDVEVEKWR